MTKLLYVGLLYDYANPDQGFSYEYYNIEAGAKQCADWNMFELKIFNIDKEIIENGKEVANAKFKSIIDEWQPDIIFDVAFDDNWTVDLDILKEAKEKGINVLFWGCDCSWRFNDFILPRKDIYSHFITTHSNTVDWFKQHNMNVIQSQWAASPMYQQQNVEKIYDVSFVGQRHSNRLEMVNALNQAGIKVNLFGRYWDIHPDNHGYIDFKEMISVFNQSKININFTLPFKIGSYLQIKGRHFEIPACGGFQLSTPANSLETYFENEKEIVVVDSLENMAKQILYYLKNDNEREMIAKAGYDRCMKDHTWMKRFEDILNAL